MAKLVLDRVSKQYDGKNFVVENFNLEIDQEGICNLCRTLRLWKIHSASDDCGAGGDYDRWHLY